MSADRVGMLAQNELPERGALETFIPCVIVILPMLKDALNKAKMACCNSLSVGRKDYGGTFDGINL
jgi:hypothetical protein